jgi:hypothetical protein
LTILPRPAAQQRQEGLDDRQVPGEVDLQLPAELGQPQELHRARHRGAGVVDQPGTAGGADPGGHQVLRGGDRGTVGHVDAHRQQPLGRGAAKGLAVLLAADAREHVKGRGGRGCARRRARSHSTIR